jgi:hypothetical protein
MKDSSGRCQFFVKIAALVEKIILRLGKSKEFAFS